MIGCAVGMLGVLVVMAMAVVVLLVLAAVAVLVKLLTVVRCFVVLVNASVDMLGLTECVVSESMDVALSLTVVDTVLSGV